MNTDRFFSKIARSDADGCWLWVAGKNKGGYGQFRDSGRTVYTHRLSYELANGPIPEGLWVLHSCDTPACVRPDHLFLGTPADNTSDCVAKGRHAHGRRHGMAKLRDDDVREIRDLIAARRYTQREIGDFYGTDQTIISDIKIGKIWAHVT